MPTYRLKKIDHVIIMDFANKEVAQEWCDLNKPGYVAELAPASEQIKPLAKTPAEKLAERKVFGQGLVDRYLLDNDAIAAERGEPLTLEESDAQTIKFAKVLAILPIGSLRQALAIITDTPTDAIFTQARKEAYILALTVFIDSQLV